MSSRRPIELAFSLLEALQAGEQLDADQAKWLSSGLLIYLEGSAGLGEALGLTKSARVKERRRIRNHYLQDAYRAIAPGDRFMGRRARAIELLEHVERLERRWDELCALTQPDPRWPRVRTALWRAKQFGRIPKTWEAIDGICGAEICITKISAWGL